MSATEASYVMVPVLTERVPAVFRFIASLDEEEAPEPDYPTGWAAELITLQFGRSSTNMKRLQRHLADHPGHKFTGDELADAIGVERGWNSIAGMLGGYQRLVQNHYGLRNWPFDFEADTDGVWKYSMRPAVAEIIRGLQSENALLSVTNLENEPGTNRSDAQESTALGTRSGPGGRRSFDAHGATTGRNDIAYNFLIDRFGFGRRA